MSCFLRLNPNNIYRDQLKLLKDGRVCIRVNKFVHPLDFLILDTSIICSHDIGKTHVSHL